MREYNLVCGVGDREFIPIKTNPVAHSMWLYILHSCYGGNSRKYVAKKEVVERWHKYSNFLEDLPSIEGYTKEDFDNGILRLERCLINNAKSGTYSKDTCRLIKDIGVVSLGDVITNRYGQVFTILKKESKKTPGGSSYIEYTIQMEPTKTIKLIHGTSKLYGVQPVKDPRVPTVHGVGYLGDYTKGCSEFKPYRIWQAMLQRCYSQKNKSWNRYGGAGVTVAERWHCFSNFLEDMTSLEGYDEELYNQGKLQLDKDLKQQGVENKIYIARKHAYSYQVKLTPRLLTVKHINSQALLVRRR